MGTGVDADALKGPLSQAELLRECRADSGRAHSPAETTREEMSNLPPVVEIFRRADNTLDGNKSHQQRLMDGPGRWWGPQAE
jgi:hypothetical protein